MHFILVHGSRQVVNSVWYKLVVRHRIMFRHCYNNFRNYRFHNHERNREMLKLAPRGQVMCDGEYFSYFFSYDYVFLTHEVFG